MNKFLTTVAIAALLAPTSAIAQDDAEMPETEEPMTEEPMTEVPEEEVPEEEAPPPPDSVLPAQESQELLSSWVTGTQVMSTQMEPIGNIQDLLIDEENGAITGAVLSVGGFLGIGAKAIAVDWSELNFDYDANEITMELTREQADTAPEYAFRERETPPPPEPPADGGGDLGVSTDPAL